MNRKPQPERHMVTMPAEVREAALRSCADAIQELADERCECVTNEGTQHIDDLIAVLAWARKCAEDQK
jgi:acyl-CoA reductase-like NAD-dependent aldehyde dehydrogenase